MNLHGIASAAIGAVNPAIPAILLHSMPYTIGSDGRQVPAYFPPYYVMVQVQPIAAGDITKLGGINVQDVQHKAYLTGNAEAIIRVLKQGGDILKFNGHTWLVNAVLERWPDWACVAITLQDDS